MLRAHEVPSIGIPIETSVNENKVSILSHTRLLNYGTPSVPTPPPTNHWASLGKYHLPMDNRKQLRQKLYHDKLHIAYNGSAKDTTVSIGYYLLGESERTSMFGGYNIKCHPNSVTSFEPVMYRALAITFSLLKLIPPNKQHRQINLM